MANEGFRMPSGSGGLVRYSDEYKSKVQLKPVHVLIIITVVIVAEIILIFAGKTV
jgi:preprotein translocase subunit Sec61beta